MTVKATWLSHSCFLIETVKGRILIDPFISGNPLAPVTADSLAPDAILVSHGHGDHVGDTVAIAKRTKAVVVSNFEIQNWMVAQGVPNVHPQHIGGAFTHPWGRVKLTQALHGSALPDGSYGGNPCGFLLYLEGRTIPACSGTCS